MIGRYLLAFAWIAFVIVPETLSQTMPRSAAGPLSASDSPLVQIAVEIKVVRIADETLAELEKFTNGQWIHHSDYGSTVVGHTTFLSDIQAFMLMEFLQSHEGTELLHAPKLMMVSGQKASIAATEERFFVTSVAARKQGEQVLIVPQSEKKELGFKATVQAAASADRRFVRVELKAQRAELGSPIVPLIPIQVPHPQLFDAPNGQGFVAKQPTLQLFVQQPTIRAQVVEQTFNMPDGSTCVIVAGNKYRPAKNVADSRPPAAASARKKLRESDESEARTVLYFVTPRIFIDEEIEREIFANQPVPTVRRRENQFAQPDRAAAVNPGPVRPAMHQEPVDTPAGPITADLNVPIKASSFDPMQMAPAAGPSDLDRLQGVWSLVHSQCSRGDGVEENTYFLVDGKRAAFQCATGTSQGGFYLDSAGKTKTFDFVTSQSTREGIYVLEGDVLLMCYDSKTGAERPTDFTIDPRGSRVLLVFKRTDIPSSIRRADGSRSFPTLTGSLPRVRSAPAMTAPPQ